MKHVLRNAISVAICMAIVAPPVLAESYEFRRSVIGLQVVDEGSISVSTESLDFSGKIIGANSKKSFSVTNNSLNPVAWKQLPAITGNASFSLFSSTCGPALAPQSSCTVTVQFTPSQESPVQGQIGFSVGGGKRVSLSGSGAGTNPLDISQNFTTLSPRQGKFASGEVTLTNNNSTSLSLGTLQFTSAKGAAYTGLDAQNCSGKTLQPATSCSITLTLSGNYSGAPLPEGPTSGVLAIPVMGKVQEHTVSGNIIPRPYRELGGGSGYASGFSTQVLCYNLNSPIYGGTWNQYACIGNSSAYYPDNRTDCTKCMQYLDGITLSALSLPFGNVILGEQKSLQVLVTNESDDAVDLALEPLSVSPANSGIFTQSTNCSVLRSGDSCIVQLDITASSVANIGGKLTLTSNAEGSPYYVQFNARSDYKNSNAGTFNVPPVTYGVAPFALTAPISDSPGVWTFSADNSGVASIAGNIVTVRGGGSTTITATQAAVSPYGPITRTSVLNVSQAEPVVQAWPNLTGKVGESLSLVAPQSSSSGTWSYTSADPSGAEIAGTSVLPKKVGTYVITANQAATSSFKASSVTTNISVEKGTPVVGTWAPLNATTVSPSIALSYPTSSSTGAWSATSSNPAVATISNGVVTVTGQGTTTITGTQAATDNYISATASMTMTVTAPVIGRTKLMWQFNGTAGTSGTTSNTLSDTGLTSSSVSGLAFLAGGMEGNFARFTNANVQIYSPEFQLTNKYFTFEWWQKGSTSIPSFTFGTPGAYSAMASNGTGVYFSLTGATWNNSFGIPSINASAWTHIAIVRDSSGMHIYKNGTKAASSPLADGYPLMTIPGNRLSFGFYTSHTSMDLDQVKLTIGEARYLSNFTPSTALTAD